MNTVLVASHDRPLLQELSVRNVTESNTHSMDWETGLFLGLAACTGAATTRMGFTMQHALALQHNVRELRFVPIGSRLLLDAASYLVWIVLCKSELLKPAAVLMPRRCVQYLPDMQPLTSC